jgi:hypothetical protein
MLSGRLLAESLQVGKDLQVPDLTVVRIGRHDVSSSTAPPGKGDGSVDLDSAGASPSQPSVWTFVDFMAPEDRAVELAEALAHALVVEDGWYADFLVGSDHVVVFAGRIFRYRTGDVAGRQQAVDYGLAAGTPRHQLDWGE